jgi:hypothetical protein
MSQPIPIGTKFKVTAGEFRGTFGVSKPNSNNSTAVYLHVHDVDDKTGDWKPRSDKAGNDVIVGVPPGAIAEA